MSETITQNVVQLLLTNEHHDLMQQVLKNCNVEWDADIRGNLWEVILYCDAATAYNVGTEFGLLLQQLPQPVATNIDAKEMLLNQFKLAPKQSMTWRHKTKRYIHHVRPVVDQLLAAGVIRLSRRTKEEITYEIVEQWKPESQ